MKEYNPPSNLTPTETNKSQGFFKNKNEKTNVVSWNRAPFQQFEDVILRQIKSANKRSETKRARTSSRFTVNKDSQSLTQIAVATQPDVIGNVISVARNDTNLIYQKQQTKNQSDRAIIFRHFASMKIQTYSKYSITGKQTLQVMKFGHCSSDVRLLRVFLATAAWR
ncbi:hypothetical protein NPIL_642221 [Nephila pilipes]|uniref:Uncharacterized protein n=1 Tax=Nephila pilipes TaxID=299642 RepID=A0A8X6U3D7_NEPPI|nr:hypothetical protein NPIL_642221 [Nephila pilipes]